MVSSNWDWVSLGDVCRVEAGAGFPIVHQGLKDQEFPFFKVGDMNTAGNEKEMHVFQHSISEEIRKKLRATAFPAGTIVFPKIGAAIATNKKRMVVKPSCVDNNVMALIPSENLDSSFLFYLLLNKDLSDFANTGNPPSIRQSNVEEWAIPLPPLTEQKRIASLLARADRLRQLRRTAHDLGDALLQSVFLEMFGEPTINDKNWDKVEIAEVTESLDSRRVPVEASIRQTKKGQYPYYGASGVIDYVDEYLFDEETLLIGEDGANLISRSSPIAFIVNGKYWVNNHAHVLKMKNMNIQFLCYLINVTDLEPYVTGSAQPKLNASNMEKIRVINPPLSLQEEFAGVVARVESLRGRMGESARQVEGLFESLLAEAFNA
jgi:type I restriction enzyme S subunit